MDPELGRFISLDPKMGRLSTPQTQDRYVYCVNNPLRVVDPSGMGFWSWLGHALFSKSYQSDPFPRPGGTKKPALNAGNNICPWKNKGFLMAAAAIVLVGGGEVLLAYSGPATTVGKWLGERGPSVPPNSVGDLTGDAEGSTIGRVVLGTPSKFGTVNIEPPPTFGKVTITPPQGYGAVAIEPPPGFGTPPEVGLSVARSDWAGIVGRTNGLGTPMEQGVPFWVEYSSSAYSGVGQMNDAFLTLSTHASAISELAQYGLDVYDMWSDSRQYS